MAEPSIERRARSLASLFAEVSPRLLGELRESGVLAGVADADARTEWQAASLHALIRGVVAEDDRSEAKADLVDALHDLVLASLAPEPEQPALRARLATRYNEYDGIARTAGRKGAASVPAAIAAACGKHLGLPAGNAFSESAASLLEALADGASAVLAETDAPELRLPPIEPLRSITARLDRAGIEWAVGASGLLASLGLVDQVNDWDIQVEADPEALRALYADLPHEFHGHGGCHADWKLSFGEARTEVIPRFAFFVPAGVVHVRLAVSRHWRGLPIASPEGWACAYALMGELDEPSLRARRAERAELLFAWLERTVADRARLEAMLKEPLPAALAERLRALPRA